MWVESAKKIGRCSKDKQAAAFCLDWLPGQDSNLRPAG